MNVASPSDSQQGRVLLTGPLGFTGRYLVKLLTDANYAVYGIAHHVKAAQSGRLITCDLRDLDAVYRAVALVKPDYVVHLAGISFVSHGDSREIYESNLLGTINLL